MPRSIAAARRKPHGGSPGQTGVSRETGRLTSIHLPLWVTSLVAFEARCVLAAEREQAALDVLRLEAHELVLELDREHGLEILVEALLDGPLDAADGERRARRQLSRPCHGLFAQVVRGNDAVDDAQPGV